MGTAATVERGQTQSKHRKPHLVLNMDINKTIIMTDSVSNKKAVHLVNETLSHAAWGEEVDGKWVLGVDKPTIWRPSTEQTVSYYEWLERSYPGVENKKRRNALCTTFCDEGHPGEKLKDFAKISLESLRRPDGTEVRILPGFFDLLLWLKREKRTFSLCFRTFGEDLSQTCAELNSFCEGSHPQFPGTCMDGSDGEPDYRLDISSKEQIGTFHRNDDEVTLIMGTTDQPGEGQFKHVKDHSSKFYEGREGIDITRGFEAVKNKLIDLGRRNGSFGLRDHFAYWKSKGMTSDGGKMFLYNPSKQTNQHELFFDDNIRFNDAHILQPINVNAPDRKQWVMPLLQTHLCRAEPLEAIPDRQWFIRQVQRLEDAYKHKFRTRARLKLTLKTFLILQRLGRVPDIIVAAAGDEKFDPWEKLRLDDHALSMTRGDSYRDMETWSLYTATGTDPGSDDEISYKDQE